jgi:periplasmic divalent cation tolerance protein
MTDLARGSIVSVYAVFADEAEARRIARIAVEERLAACANILGPCFSIYRWQGRIEEAGEVAAVFKTTAGAAPGLIERIAALHSYEVPAAVAWPIADALAGYAEWVAENVATRADNVEAT